MLVDLIIKTQEELRANKNYSAADKLDPILEEAKKDGWITGNPPEDGEYLVSGFYEKTRRRLVGEADYIGKWLVAEDFHVEAWRPKLRPY